MQRILASLLCGLFVVTACFLPALTAQEPEEALPNSMMTVDGRELYESYCASCHGIDARGNGPVAASLRIAPPDLTRIAQRNAGFFPTQKIEQIIAGEEGAGSHGSRQMPIWGPVFSVVEWDMDFVEIRLRNLADYLESLQR